MSEFWSNPKSTISTKIPKPLKISKKSSTAEEKRHMGRVAALGCIICKMPANVHHIRTERIKSDFLTIPLCKEHHQGDFSIHMSKMQFENIYGSELHLLAKTIEMLGK